MARVPIERLTSADLDAMIGRDAESSTLEFKVDIPVHPQSGRDKVLNSVCPPRDPWWLGKAVAPHGRDELLAEVVAFANAQGGRLLLGIAEETGTTLAKEICPLPRIAELEGRFIDFFLSCVEPRLPHFSVRGVETDGQGGGVLAVEVQPSRIGPHRVTRTLVVPTRRGDKCMPTTMAEVHGMVLRNARRFEELRTMLDARADSLEPTFVDFLYPKIDVPLTSHTVAQHILTWLAQRELSAFAIRVIVCAHEDLGIPRLATFDALVPNKTTVGQATPTGYVATKEMTSLWPLRDDGKRYLGGVSQKNVWPFGLVEFNVSREGLVEQTFFLFRNQHGHIVTQAQTAGFVGSALGIYDLLRVAAGRPDMPAEVSIKLLTRGEVRVGSGQLTSVLGSILPAEAVFPRRTVASEADFSDIIAVTIQDLLDSADDKSPAVPKFAYSRTSFKHEPDISG